MYEYAARFMNVFQCKFTRDSRVSARMILRRESNWHGSCHRCIIHSCQPYMNAEHIKHVTQIHQIVCKWENFSQKILILKFIFFFLSPPSSSTVCFLHFFTCSRFSLFLRIHCANCTLAIVCLLRRRTIFFYVFFFNGDCGVLFKDFF